MKIGFTGTRKGMTDAQKLTFETILVGFEAASAFHHGGAIGADFEAWQIAREHGLSTVCHPSNLVGTQAKTADDEVHQALKPLDRNKLIVAAADVMIATPEGEEVRRSGTWATIRHARKSGKPLCVIYPDGRAVWEKEVSDGD